MAIQGKIDLTQFRAEDWGSTKRFVYGLYTGPKSYSNFFTNNGTGDPLVPGDVKLGQIHLMFFAPGFTSVGVPRFPAYVSPQQGGPPGGTIVWYQASTDLEVANGTDLSTYSAYFEALGL